MYMQVIHTTLYYLPSTTSLMAKTAFPNLFFAVQTQKPVSPLSAGRRVNSDNFPRDVCVVVISLLHKEIHHKTYIRFIESTNFSNTTLNTMQWCILDQWKHLLTLCTYNSNTRTLQQCYCDIPVQWKQFLTLTLVSNK